jgi:hypothetical protein
VGTSIIRSWMSTDERKIMSTEPVEEPEVLQADGQHPDDVEPDEPVDEGLEPLGGDPEDLEDDAELDDTLNGGGAPDPGDDPVLDEEPDEDETGDGKVYHDTTGGE